MRRQQATRFGQASTAAGDGYATVGDVAFDDGQLKLVLSRLMPDGK